jgi:phage-related protein
MRNFPRFLWKNPRQGKTIERLCGDAYTSRLRSALATASDLLWTSSFS